MINHWYFPLLIIVSLMFISSSFFYGCDKGESTPTFECTDSIGCVDIAPGEPIKLWAIQDLSGPATFWGKQQLQVIEFALAERNNELLGHPIVLLTEDSGCSPGGGTTAALRAVADPQTVAIIGPTCPPAAIPASQVMSEAGLVMIMPIEAASLTSIGGQRGADWQPGFFSTGGNATERAIAAAVFAAQELGVTKAAVIDTSSGALRDYTDAFAQKFIALGGEIVISTSVDQGDTNMEPVLAATDRTKPEFILLSVPVAEAIHLVQQSREVAGLEGVTLLGVIPLFVDEFIQAVGADGIGIYSVTGKPLVLTAAAEEALVRYEERYTEQLHKNTFVITIMTMDAVELLLNGIETAAVKEADGTLRIGLQALRDALYAISFEGAAGQISCDEFGNCRTVSHDIVRLDDSAAGVEGFRSNVVYSYTPDE